MRILLYGDSMTEYLHRPPRMLTDALQALQPEKAYEISNWAVGGTRAELVLYRLLYEFWHGRERMLPLTQSRPDVLVIEACAFNNANDQQDGINNFKHIWDQIIKACRERAPQARLITYLTIGSSPTVPDERANRLFFHALPEVFALRHKWREIYQDAFEQWATEAAVECVNVRNEVQRQEALGVPRQQWISTDGVHPNAAGVELISQKLAAAIVGSGEIMP